MAGTKLNGREGFTLIELMIVIAIIGILAAIAIPQFQAYRVRGFNGTSLGDIRNLATAQECYYVETATYCNSVTNLLGANYGYVRSNGVIIETSGDSSEYTITAYHSSGDRTYTLAGPGGVIAD